MDNGRVTQWLIPFLYGVAVGIMVAWNAEVWLPARDAISKYVSLFGIAALFIAILLKYRTGYNWPWEGPTEWAEAGRASRKASLWLIIVLLLLALFTLLLAAVSAPPLGFRSSISTFR